jgi:hypothetical protein
MMIVPENIEEIFAAFEKQIIVQGGFAISIVVCGGTALAAVGLVKRATRDVDVLGEIVWIDGEMEIRRIDKFPKWFQDAAKIIERDFGLPNNWINTGPTSQVDSGLPDLFKNRLIKREYGKYLTVYFISRIDQIFFKLYASVDRDGYHVEDLFKLNPTEKEIYSASQWVLTQDVSEGFRVILLDFLRKNGFENVAARL